MVHGRALRLPLSSQTGSSRSSRLGLISPGKQDSSTNSHRNWTSSKLACTSRLGPVVESVTLNLQRVTRQSDVGVVFFHLDEKNCTNITASPLLCGHSLGGADGVVDLHKAASCQRNVRRGKRVRYKVGQAVCRLKGHGGRGCEGNVKAETDGDAANAWWRETMV